MKTDIMDYTPTPMQKNFHDNKSRRKFFCSGDIYNDTITCLLECGFVRAITQQPDDDGIRKVRTLIISRTSDDRERVFNMAFGLFYGCRRRGFPLPSLIICFPHPDGKTKCEAELIFAILQPHDDINRLRGYELSIAFFNKASQFTENELIEIDYRCGRYPYRYENKNGEVVGGPTYYGIISNEPFNNQPS